jgi:endonuclease/exonuclease/phosphatase family metal-dependent hydrolase
VRCGRVLRHSVITLAITVCALGSASAAEFGLQLLAETSLPGDLEVDGILVGGLSGLTYDQGCDLYYVVSDDRGRYGPPRFFTLTINRVGNAATIEILEATALRNLEGGLLARGEVDPEALVLDPDGRLLISSEGAPHRGVQPLIARFTLDGRMLGEIPLPQRYLASEDGARGVRDNLAFEGLALAPAGDRLFAVAENALIQDGPAADLGQGSPARLLVMDLATGSRVGEYVYEVGPVPDEPKPASAFRTNGVSEILAIGDHRLLAVERSFSAGVGNRVRLYLVDLDGATNIEDIDSLARNGGKRPRPVAKIPIADLADLGITPDNIEGMALGPALDDGRRLLVMVADNNFQPSVQTNQVLLFALAGLAPPIVEMPPATVHEIQGASHFSPLVGRCVAKVSGVVTAILGSRKGQAFWIQDPVGDGNPATSEGVLVTALDGLPQVAVGDVVHLGGRVEERSWRTELPVTRLVASDVEIVRRHHDLPPPVTLGDGGLMIPQPDVASTGLHTFDPVGFAADAFESLEGMRVRIENPVIVGPTSRHGEIVVLAGGGRGAAVRTARGGVRLLDDNANPQRVVIDDRLVPDPPDLSVGDVLTGPVDGILHYGYGSYKLLNTRPLPSVVSGRLDRERTSLKSDAAHLRVATFNLENLSARSPDEKYRRLAAVVAGSLGSPDILAVQEVQDDSGPEDDGTVSADETLRRLVEAIEAVGGVHYAARLIDPVDKADGGQPGANIRTAFLFNPKSVEFVDRAGCAEGSGVDVVDGPSLTCSPGLVDPGNQAFATGEDGRGGSRKPLVGEFRYGGRRLFVVNLHLASKGGDDPLFGRQQPPKTPSTDRRNAQAGVVAELVGELLARDPEAAVLVLGDLNDFEASEPLATLEGAGLEDLVTRLPLGDRYTYVYLGNSQVLDHILVSSNLTGSAEVDIVHLDSESPAADRASDHDPVIVRLGF